MLTTLPESQFPAKSLIFVKDKRSGIMPNSGFEKQLRKYEKEVAEILYLS